MKISAFTVFKQLTIYNLIWITTLQPDKQIDQLKHSIQDPMFKMKKKRSSLRFNIKDRHRNKIYRQYVYIIVDYLNVIN